MSTLTLSAGLVKPAVAPNPRDSWPDWTDGVRWGLGPDDAPEFVPSAEEQAAASALLNADATDYFVVPTPDLPGAGQVVKSLDCFLALYPRHDAYRGGAL